MPYLICSPVPSGPAAPTTYSLSFNGAAATDVAATVNPNNTVQLHYDLASFPNGSYSVVAVAKNSGGASSSSSPFAFVIANPVAPATPVGLAIIP
jgi:hypothetical protein